MSATKTEVRNFFQRLPDKISFFRQEEVEELKNRFKYGNFLAVFGEERHQVRSLIADGLLPALQPEYGNRSAATTGKSLWKSDVEGRAGFSWSVAPILEPGANPVGNLADILALPGVLRSAVEADFGRTLEKKLRSGINGLLDIYEEEKDPGEFNLVIVIDRLEDIAMFRQNHTWHGDTGDDALFFNLILSAIRSSLPVYVILLMDSDSLNQVYQYSGFLEDIDQNRFTIRKTDPGKIIGRIKEAVGVQVEYAEKLNLSESISRDFPVVADYLKELDSAIRLQLSRNPGMQGALSLLRNKVDSDLAAAAQFKNLSRPEKDSLRERLQAFIGQSVKLESEQLFLNILEADLRNGSQAGDPYTLYKLKFALYLIRKAIAEESEIEINLRYKENGKINRAIDLYFDRKFGEMKTATGDTGPEVSFTRARSVDQKIIERSFKALTEKDPTGVAVRRPVYLSELIELCRRQVTEAGNISGSADDPWGDATTRDLTENQVLEQLLLFNTPIYPFIRIIDPPADEDQERIVYIAEEAIVPNWNKIKAWTDQEVVDAGIYKGLIEYARAFYRKESTPAVESDGSLSNDATTTAPGFFRRIWTWITDYIRMVFGSVRRELQMLNKKIEFSLKEDFNPGEKLSLNAIRLPFQWKQLNIPNETWAKRYYKPHQIPVPEQPPEDPEALEEYNLNKYLVQEKGIEHHFALARTYYGLSLENVKGIVERREREKERRVNNSKKLTLVFFVLAIVAVIATIRASSLRRAEKINRQNVELFNFLDILSQTQAIRKEIPTEYYNDKLKEKIRTQSILDEEGMEASMRGMLKFLADSYYIPLMPNPVTNGTGKNSAAMDIVDKFNTLSINAALTLNSLKVAENAQNPQTLLIRSADDILKIAGEGIAFNKSIRDTFYQFPLIYKALEEHITTFKRTLYEKFKDLDHSPFLHKDTALVMAFASNPGIEAQYAYGDALGHVRIFNGIDDFKTAFSAERITALTYADSATLLAGTFRGHILRYDGLATDPRGKGVFPYTQLELGPDMDKPVSAIYRSGDYLLVATPWELKLLVESPRGQSNRYAQVQTIRLDTSLHEIRACAMTPGGDKIIAGGDGALQIFELRGDGNRSLVPLKTIRFPNKAVTALAVSEAYTSAFGENQSILAQGFEDGLVLLTPVNDLLANDHYQGNQGILILQSSTISTLGFNPRAHQLASSSLDGSIVLWNLDLIAPGRPEAAIIGNEYDHIRLEESGQGMWGIVYINANELFSTENLTIRKWKTNIEGLKTELEKLLNEYKNNVGLLGQ